MLRAQTLALLTHILSPEAELSDKQKKRGGECVPSTSELSTISQLR